MRKRFWLGIGGATFLVTAAVAVVESWSGNLWVAQTLNALCVVMFVGLAAGLAVGFVFRKRENGWPTMVVASLSVIVILLGLVGGYAFYRGHTAAEGFVEKAGEFSLPGQFVVDDSATPTADVYQTEFVARVWTLDQPTGDSCATIAQAYRDWAEKPIDEYLDKRCALESTENAEKSRIELRDGVVTLELWMAKAEGF